MGSNSLSGKALSNMIWRFAERCGAQGVAFIVSIVLARILAPEDYGTIALVTVFTAILNVFIDSGFGTALVQKKNADELDFSTVFYFNIIMCGALYVLMFFAAPYIAAFYDDAELTPVVRVLSLTLVISGVKNIQQAYVSRTLQFKKFFFATLGGTIGAAVLGIIIAYNGGGVWALVAQQIFNAAVDTIILWLTIRWRPKRMFSFKRLKELFSFGWKLLISSLLDTFYNKLRQLIIGYQYSKDDLAYYNKGEQFPLLIVANINSSIDSVLLPTMSKYQDNKEYVKKMTRRSIMTSTFIMAPIMMGLAAVADSLIGLLLKDKWLPCIPYLRIFCITFIFHPIHTANLNAIKAMGRSDLFLKLEILKKAIGLAVLMSTMWFGVMAMAYSLLFTSLTSQIINSWPNKKLLDYSYRDQLKDIIPNILQSVIMFAATYAIEYIPMLPRIAVLILQVMTGATIYIFLSALTKNESFNYIMNIINGYRKRGKDNA